jgi:hypothetical protein
LFTGPGHLFAVAEISVTAYFAHRVFLVSFRLLVVVSHGDSCYPVSDEPQSCWRSQREGLIARPVEQRLPLLVFNPLTHTPRNDDVAESGMGCASQSVDGPPVRAF